MTELLIVGAIAIALVIIAGVLRPRRGGAGTGTGKIEDHENARVRMHLARKAQRKRRTR